MESRENETGPARCVTSAVNGSGVTPFSAALPSDNEANAVKAVNAKRTMERGENIAEVWGAGSDKP
jgi:hypothetical protein